jgi:hypothetical protein
MLAIIYYYWNTDFAKLIELRTKLKTFIDAHELNAENIEDRAFTIKKSDYLKIIDAIDKAAYDGNLSVSYADLGVEIGTLKGAIGSEIEVPIMTNFILENDTYT